MALLKCVECGKEVSTRATNCPGCGAPVNAPVTRKNWEPCPRCGSGRVNTGSGVWALPVVMLTGLLFLAAIVTIIAAPPLGLICVVAIFILQHLYRKHRSCRDCRYTWVYRSQTQAGAGQVGTSKGKRTGLVILGGGLFLGFVVLLGIGFLAERHTQKEFARADALWSESKQADATSIYMAQLESVDVARRPEVYTRIISYLSDSGDKERAVEYCNLALAEGLDLKFGYSDLDRMFDGARQVIVEREEKELAEKQAEEQRVAQEKAAVEWAEKQAEAQQAAVEKEMNRGNVEATRQFYETLTVVGFQGVIADLYSHKDGPPWKLTITVNAGWDALPHSTRTEYAKTFRGAWAGVCPVEPGGASISIDIVNMAGKKVGGGSRSQDSYWAD